MPRDSRNLQDLHKGPTPLRFLGIPSKTWIIAAVLLAITGKVLTACSGIQGGQNSATTRRRSDWRTIYFSLEGSNPDLIGFDSNIFVSESLVSVPSLLDKGVRIVTIRVSYHEAMIRAPLPDRLGFLPIRAQRQLTVDSIAEMSSGPRLHFITAGPSAELLHAAITALTLKDGDPEWSRLLARGGPETLILWPHVLSNCARIVGWLAALLALAAGLGIFLPNNTDRQARRAARGQCPACAYPIFGPICPECGLTLPAPDPQSKETRE